MRLRLDKHVGRVLKSTFYVYGDTDAATEEAHNLTDDEMDAWARSVWYDFLTEPIIDEIAATYGLTEDELLEELRSVRFFINLPQPFSQYPGYGITGGFLGSGRIEVRLEPEIFLQDMRQEIFNTLAHELDHHARDITGGDFTYGAAPPLTEDAFITYVTSDHEWAAIKNEIERMLMLGWSDKEIEAILFSGPYGDMARDHNAEDWWARYIPGIVEGVKEEIEVETV